MQAGNNTRGIQIAHRHHHRGKGYKIITVSALKLNVDDSATASPLQMIIIRIAFLYFLLFRSLFRLSPLLTQNNKHHGSDERPHQTHGNMFKTAG